MTRFSSYDEELKMNTIEDNGVYASGDKIKNYIPSMEDRDIENFIIISSKLLYIGKNELETEVAEKLKLGGSGDVSDVGAVVEEVQQIVDNVVNVSEGNKDKVPAGDSDKLDDLNKLKEEGKEQHTDDSEGLIGVRLFTRNGLNMNNGNWNILIEYNSSNKETARYGTGYYWLKKGTTYKINGEEIEFKNDYVVDYSKGEYYVLSGRAVNWNVKSTLGVSDNIALNLDPMSLANGKWIETNEDDKVNQEKYQEFIVDTSGNEVKTGIKKTGDVEYDSKNKALKFNEDKEKISTGEGGYLRLSKNGLDFKNGFTFEFYGNLTRGPYKNVMHNTIPGAVSVLGIFWRVDDPLYGDVGRSMRLSFGENGGLCDFCNNSTWVGEGWNMRTGDGGDVFVGDSWESAGINLNEDFYMTVVYRVFDEGNENQEEYDEFMKKQKNLDRIEYYLNGELQGYTYYAKNSFKIGLDTWNNDSYDFYIGVCAASGQGNLFFLKGLNYSTRLYQIPLTPEQVKLNYDMTLKYRDSFKNE